MFSLPINYLVVLMWSPLLKKGIVLEVEKKHLPLHVGSLKFGVAPQTFNQATSVVAKFATTASDGKVYQVDYPTLWL